MVSVWTKFRSALRAFRVANAGNVAITFAFATLPIIAAVGFAIDYSHANSVKVAMQAALDSTALMLSKEAATDTSTQLQTNAQKYFLALFTRPEATNVTLTASYDTSSGTTLLVNGSADVPTSLLGIIGYNTITVNGSSTAKWGSNRLRVALVLDNTGSMADSGKMPALQAATKSLLTQLQGAASTNGDVYVSIVPFVKDVNLGAANYNSSYLDFTTWQAAPPYMATWLSNSTNVTTWEQTGPGDTCPFTTSKQGFVCNKTPANNAATTGTVPSSGTYSGYICPSMDHGGKLALQASVYYNGCYNSTAATRTIASGRSASCGSAVSCSCSGSGSHKVCTQSYFNHTWTTTFNPTSTWNGCVVDRGNAAAPDSVGNYDTNAVAPSTTIASTLYSAEQYDACPQAVMPLSYNWTAMNSLVTNMSPNGNTNQAIGLQLGWMSLVGGGPFTAPPMQSGYNYTQVIILLTDGLNTQDRWYTSQNSIDARQKLTCDNINAAGITLYTIQVNTGGDPTSTLLKNCAGSPGKYPDSDKFFLLTSASQIMTVFTQIGTNLSQLRVAK